MADKKALSRDQILGAVDLLEEEVHVREWGGYVKVRGLTAAQRDRYEQSIVTMRGRNIEANLEQARAKLVVLCAVNGDGKALFQEDDVKALGAKSARALNRVWEVARRLSGLTDEDVQELVKNS